MNRESPLQRMIRLEEEADQAARRQQWINMWRISKLIILIGVITAVIKFVWKMV